MVFNHNQKCLLSIVIPVFNRQKTFDLLMTELSRAIIQHKLEEKVEIIVIDDASPKALKLLQLPCSVILERNQKNLGAPSSRARGLQLSHGKYIHFHDSDDSMSDDWLAEILHELTQNPKIDILFTGRIDYEHHCKTYRYPSFLHKQVTKPERILARLIYWNIIGPIGGVTFSRQVLQSIKIRNIASCQDWQMYIDAIKTAETLSSRPDIQFFFHKTGTDRISNNPRKKILGHLQLAKLTKKDTIFGKNIRLFYLYACKRHILNKRGLILKFYKRHQFKIFIMFLIITAYSFMPAAGLSVWLSVICRKRNDESL